MKSSDNGPAGQQDGEAGQPIVIRKLDRAEATTPLPSGALGN